MGSLKNSVDQSHPSALAAVVEPGKTPPGQHQGSAHPKKKRNKATLPRRFRRDFLMKLSGREGLGHSLTQDLRAIESDMGGIESMSHAQQTLAQRAVWLTEILREHERRVAAGHGIDLGAYVRGVQTLTTLLKTLGLRRTARTLPTLAEYAAQQEPQP